MIACARQSNEGEIAHEHHGFGHLWNAGKAEPRREFPLVHDAFGGEIRVLGEVRHDGVAIARVEQGATHELRVHRAFMAIAESHGTGLLEEADLRHLLSGEPLGERRARQDAQGRSGARPPQDEIHDRRIIDHGIGIRTADQGGDPARGRGSARRGERLAMFGARLADEGLKINEARSQHESATVDDAHLLVRLA